MIAAADPDFADLKKGTQRERRRHLTRCVEWMAAQQITDPPQVIKEAVLIGRVAIDQQQTEKVRKANRQKGTTKATAKRKANREAADKAEAERKAAEKEDERKAMAEVVRNFDAASQHAADGGDHPIPAVQSDATVAESPAAAASEATEEQTEQVEAFEECQEAFAAFLESKPTVQMLRDVTDYLLEMTTAPPQGVAASPAP